MTPAGLAVATLAGMAFDRPANLEELLAQGRDGCVFCAIARGDSPAWIVHSDEHTMAFMDLLPMTRGHCLVIPRRHHDDIWDLDAESSGHVMEAATTVAHKIRRALRPLGLNLLNNNGRAADQSQFHFHIHVIPRYGHDRLLHPWERTFGDPAEIAAVADLINGAGPDR